MKAQLFILPSLTAMLVVVAGCKSGSHQTSQASASPTPAAPGGATAANTSGSQAAPAPGVTKTLPQPVRIKAGAAAIKDASGNSWLADMGFEGGDVIDRPDLAIANTKDPEIYRSEHYSMNSFAYQLANGRYQVKLHFCETYEGITGPGERVFSFDVEGKTIKDFDIWAKAGGFARAYVETVPVEIADGRLDIKFTPGVENPQINGIEILPVQ